LTSSALVERAGEVVGKEELIARAWPQTFVEEANLKFQVSALRRAPGDGQGGHRYVVTVPGRGYNFVAPVSLEGPSRAPLPPRISPAGLSEDEQLFFRALGIFAGGFTVEAAAATIVNAVNACDEIDRLADLVPKSLVAADVGGARPRFRLLDTTRA
jgi:hypothetical protein